MSALARHIGFPERLERVSPELVEPISDGGHKRLDEPNDACCLHSPKLRPSKPAIAFAMITSLLAG